MAIKWKVTVDLGTEVKTAIITDNDITGAEHKFLDQLEAEGYTEADFVEVTTERTHGDTGNL